ncbi:MAG: NADH dehydrogenase [ubiquinone] 1 alpha subcomplex assembly factor 1 [Mariniblastus sp.]|jgi:NADH dehydrogenase [ubiquinone] 1 alpha subcomplex assembly factor 1
MNTKQLILFSFSALSFLSVVQITDRALFNFDSVEASKSWQIVNDGVMGGRSVSQIKITQDKKMEFSGTLSLENNGGFASVRARRVQLNLTSGDSIVIKVRGDGRDYNFNLYAQNKVYSYRQSFKTKQGEWTEVVLPVKKFVATWRGNVYPNEVLDPSKVTGVGILLGDKKPGAFKLDIESIKARPKQN